MHLKEIKLYFSYKVDVNFKSNPEQSCRDDFPKIKPKKKDSEASLEDREKAYLRLMFVYLT
jgi:hypothetical protein